MAKLAKNQKNMIIENLENMYPDAEPELIFGTVFQLLVAVVLSAQTTDKSVNQVTEVLFKTCPDAASIARLPEEELQTILKRIGMYKTKAKNVRLLSKIIQEEYGGEVPGDFEKLTALPGVGRKTANVVLANGFGEPHIAVDTHVFRVSNRLGLVQEKDVLKTELALMKVIPKEKWTLMHHAIIFHGRRICNARKPKCGECRLADLCLYHNSSKSE